MSGTKKVLFECDQCSNREWRWPDQEPWLCTVCGYYRWSVVSEENGGIAPAESGPRRP